ncbi:MAG: hypothetical protein IT305_29105 [Chloroflexi bacterium]|nr:hypothetical protein [Chloroflexota bacterium]
MRTYTVHGGWRAYLLLAVVGLTIVIVGLAAGFFVALLVAIGALVLLADRAMRVLGFRTTRRYTPSTRSAGTNVIEGTYRVIEGDRTESGRPPLRP